MSHNVASDAQVCVNRPHCRSGPKRAVQAEEVYPMLTITLQQAAEAIGVCVPQVRKWIRSGHLHAIRTEKGKRVRVSLYSVLVFCGCPAEEASRLLRSDLDQLLASQATRPDRVPELPKPDAGGQDASPRRKGRMIHPPRTFTHSITHVQARRLADQIRRNHRHTRTPQPKQ
jgi:excisionase family DNA binding protein